MPLTKNQILQINMDSPYHYENYDNYVQAVKLTHENLKDELHELENETEKGYEILLNHAYTAKITSNPEQKSYLTILKNNFETLFKNYLNSKEILKQTSTPFEARPNQQNTCFQKNFIAEHKSLSDCYYKYKQEYASFILFSNYTSGIPSIRSLKELSCKIVKKLPDQFDEHALTSLDNNYRNLKELISTKNSTLESKNLAQANLHVANFYSQEKNPVGPDNSDYQELVYFSLNPDDPNVTKFLERFNAPVETQLENHESYTETNCENESYTQLAEQDIELSYSTSPF